jgi:hypothetical protein
MTKPIRLPSGTVINPSIDSAGRTAGITKGSGSDYLAGAGYDDPNRIQQAPYGRVVRLKGRLCF